MSELDVLLQIEDNTAPLESIQNSINENVDSINERMDIVVQTQYEQISGDKLIIEEIQKNTQAVIMVNMVLIITLIFTFIVRCFK